MIKYNVKLSSLEIGTTYARNLLDMANDDPDNLTTECIRGMKSVPSIIAGDTKTIRNMIKIGDAINMLPHNLFTKFLEIQDAGFEPYLIITTPRGKEIGIEFKDIGW